MRVNRAAFSSARVPSTVGAPGASGATVAATAAAGAGSAAAATAKGAEGAEGAGGGGATVAAGGNDAGTKVLALERGTKPWPGTNSEPTDILGLPGARSSTSPVCPEKQFKGGRGCRATCAHTHTRN